VKLLLLDGSTLRLSGATAQARVGLELVDDHHEIVEPDDPFELEAGAASRVQIT
jgi:hypothetical protein